MKKISDELTMEAITAGPVDRKAAAETLKDIKIHEANKIRGVYSEEPIRPYWSRAAENKLKEKLKK